MIVFLFTFFTTAHAGLVELGEFVDVLALKVGHQVLQVAARALGVDVGRILPDRRQARIDTRVFRARTAIAQGHVGVGAAVGDGSDIAVVENVEARVPSGIWS